LETLEIPLETLEITLVSAILETIHATWVTLETTHEEQPEPLVPPVLPEPQELQQQHKRSPLQQHNQRNKPLRLWPLHRRQTSCRL
jgi:hypothetical protein